MQKTFWKFILCFCLLTSVALTSFATTITSSDDSDSATVKANYVDLDEPEIVYSVEITWGNMEFTYDDGTVQNVWDPQTHTYTTQTVTGGIGWTCDENANKVTVVNKSNAPLQATVSTAVTNTSVGSVSAKVTVNNVETGTIPLSDASSGATTEISGTESQGTAVITLNGKPNNDIQAKTVIGKVTVTLNAVSE